MRTTVLPNLTAKQTNLFVKTYGPATCELQDDSPNLPQHARTSTSGTLGYLLGVTGSLRQQEEQKDDEREHPRNDEARDSSITELRQIFPRPSSNSTDLIDEQL